MTVLYLVPKWFIGVSVGLELAFALITLIVALYSAKIYCLSRQRELKFFSVAFFLVSISYIIRSILNAFVANALNGDTISLSSVGHLQSISFIGVYAHIVLFTAGLVTLVYATMKVKDEKIYLLLMFLAMLGVATSFNKAATFYLTSAILLLFISLYYLIECKKKPNTKRTMVLIAFVLIFVSTFDFLFSINYYIHFIIGHVLELIAYLLILGSLTMALNHEQKKE